MIKYFAMQLFNRRNATRIKSTGVSLRGQIGRGVKIQRGTHVDKHSSIGGYSYLGNHCSVTAAKIGRYCSIGDNVVIGPGEHNMDGISTSTEFSQSAFAELTRKPCTIGNDVWIGAQSLILRGVTIGDGAVVGANSVVTRNVAPFDVVAGSPARVIRNRVTPEVATEILASKWWDQDRDAAAKTIAALTRKTA